MKTRIISALIAIILVVPILIKGGFIFDLAVYILSIIGLWEFLRVKNSKKEISNFVKFISYVILTLILLLNANNGFSYEMDYRLLSVIFIVFLIPTVLYHDRKKYSVNDAFYLIGGIFFIAISMSLFIVVRNMGLSLFVYLILISTMTDSFAYFTGMLIGKHKLIEEVSPKKTWEGMLGGTILGSFIAVTFYLTVVDSSISILLISLVTIFLSIIGQFGDLVFSAIKRYFHVKDFSNIMPGHGGVLDRLDSIIFIMLAFTFLTGIL